MIRTSHTRSQLAKATAAAIATAALFVPGALANSGPRSNALDPWLKTAIAAQRNQPDSWLNSAIAEHRSLATQADRAKQTGYRFITDTLAPGGGQPRTSGYQFITDTLAPGGGASGNSVALASHGFDWADAGVGAAGTLGLALLVLTGRVVALRKRGRLAF
jgi:hypothetical protein